MQKIATLFRYCFALHMKVSI